MKTTEQRARKFKQLTALARKAAEAHDKFAKALEKAKADKNWNVLCDTHNINPDATSRDWMC